MMSNDTANVSMQDPLAFFFTWPTYGTWLPGDTRGWVEFHRGWQLPNVDLERAAQQAMQESTCLLTDEQRLLVEHQVSETCQYRHWHLFAVECRSNHIHVVVGAVDTGPKKIRADIKAWCTRRLRKAEPGRKDWWADRGSIRYIWDDESLERVICYVAEAQDRKDRDHM